MYFQNKREVVRTEGKVVDDVTDVRGLWIQVMVLGPGLNVEVTRNSVMVGKRNRIERGWRREGGGRSYTMC
jgi:hypothetical protein